MTPRIQPLEDSQAPAESAEILRQTKAKIGMVPNLYRTLAHAPAALSAYTNMAGSLAGGKLTPQLREQIAVATAGLNGCSYCASAHTAIGKGLRIEEGELTRNLGAESSNPKTATVLSFVRALVENKGAIEASEFATVREAGFSDQEIVEIVTHVGLNTFTNLFNVFARTEIDFPIVELTTAT